jgi:hypothetical protein
MARTHARACAHVVCLSRVHSEVGGAGSAVMCVQPARPSSRAPHCFEGEQHDRPYVGMPSCFALLLPRQPRASTQPLELVAVCMFCAGPVTPPAYDFAYPASCSPATASIALCILWECTCEPHTHALCVLRVAVAMYGCRATCVPVRQHAQRTMALCETGCEASEPALWPWGCSKHVHASFVSGRCLCCLCCCAAAGVSGCATTCCVVAVRCPAVIALRRRL